MKPNKEGHEIEGMRYRRADTAGGSYFFKVNLADRRSDVLVSHIQDLREVTTQSNRRTHLLS